MLVAGQQEAGESVADVEDMLMDLAGGHEAGDDFLIEGSRWEFAHGDDGFGAGRSPEVKKSLVLHQLGLYDSGRRGIRDNAENAASNRVYRAG
jgi:hypothetical protein